MRLAVGAALAAALAFAGAAHAHSPAPASPPTEFEPPAPGTYSLPPIQVAPDGEVLDTRGKRHALAQLTRGRITLLGLVYTRCTDTQGCPLATWAFSAVRKLIRGDTALERRVRLVTLSFDPAHDVPAEMAAYARRMRATGPGAQWDFLTTASRAALDPILEGLGQDLSVAAGSKAVPGTEEFSHTLKVFLIDPEGRVREIYSSAWLHPGVIVNDIRTIAGSG
jgi:cytochrome oxidase Cu insertion factor (SCO1/SenC/PrrC family)